MAAEHQYALHKGLPRLLEESWFFGDMREVTRPQRNDGPCDCIHRQPGQSRALSMACQTPGSHEQTAGAPLHVHRSTAVVVQPHIMQPVCLPIASPRLPPKSRNTSMIFGMSMSTRNPGFLDSAQNDADQWSGSKMYSQSEQKPMNSLPVEELMVMLRFHAQAGQLKSGNHVKQPSSEHQTVDLDLARISEPLPSLVANGSKKRSLLTLTFQKLHAGLPPSGTLPEVHHTHASCEV